MEGEDDYDYDCTLDEFVEGDDPNAKPFERVVVQKSNQKQIVLTNVRGSWTLQRLLEELKDKDQDFAELKNVTLICNSKVLSDKNKKLHEYGFKEDTIVWSMFTVVGGDALTREAMKFICCCLKIRQTKQYPNIFAIRPKTIKASNNRYFNDRYKLEESSYNAQTTSCQNQIVTSLQIRYGVAKILVNAGEEKIFQARFDFDINHNWECINDICNLKNILYTSCKSLL